MFDTKLKVLVVDDMATVRLVMTQCLMDLGFTDILQASTGQMAWDVLTSAESQIGLILSDWNMPKLTGVELLRLIRGDRRYAKVPFLLVTTESESQRVIEAVKAGVDDYIVKPFTTETLREKLEAVYKRKSTQ